MANVYYKLQNGKELEGEEEEVLKVAKAFGEDPSAGGYKYYSQSKKEYVHIHDMDTQYLVNALLKRHKENIEKLDRKDHKRILDQFNGAIDASEAFMIQELRERLEPK